MFALAVSVGAVAQDIIVTTKLDSILCDVVQYNKKGVVYSIDDTVVTLHPHQVYYVQKQNAGRPKYYNTDFDFETVWLAKTGGIRPTTKSIGSATLAESYVDEFTGNTIRRTAWQQILNPWEKTSYFRLSKINNKLYFEFKLVLGEVFAIREGQEIMFKLSNDSVVALANTNFEVTCVGCGSTGMWASNAHGIHVLYLVDNESLKKLQDFFAIKARIYTTDGYIDETLRSQDQNKIRNAALLFPSQ